jgi:hypothetical protein
VIAQHQPARQDHDERPELVRAAGDAQLAGIGPVDPGLLADERLDAEEASLLGTGRTSRTCRRTVRTLPS